MRSRGFYPVLLCVAATVMPFATALDDPPPGHAANPGAVREVAWELTRIANDLRLLSSGPRTGLAEIRLPAVQPGSSIMSG